LVLSVTALAAESTILAAESTTAAAESTTAGAALTVLSAVVADSSEEELLQAANAPIANTNKSFFILLNLICYE
jgi:hypothetical protein